MLHGHRQLVVRYRGRESDRESYLRCTNCLVKSSNERDPRVQLLISPPGEMHPVRTARVKWEEDEGDGRSVWPESHGLHVAYNGQDNWLRRRKAKLIPQTCPKFGLGAETRPHEAGIPSNRLSSSSGEYVPAPCTHRPSSHPSEFLVRLRLIDAVELEIREGG